MTTTTMTTEHGRVVLCKSNRELPKVPSHIVAFVWRSGDSLMTIEEVYVPGDPRRDSVVVTKPKARTMWNDLWAKGYRRLTDKCRT